MHHITILWSVIPTDIPRRDNPLEFNNYIYICTYSIYQIHHGGGEVYNNVLLYRFGIKKNSTSNSCGKDNGDIKIVLYHNLLQIKYNDKS